MRTLCVMLVGVVLMVGQVATSQVLTFVLRNPQILSGTTFQYEVWIKSSNGTSRMGSILVYNHYSTAGFGTSVVAKGKVTVAKGSGFGSTYALNANNDNSSSVFAYSWTYQGVSGNGVVIPLTPDSILAFTVQILIADGSKTSGISFDAFLMGDQQYLDDETNTWPSLVVTDTLDVPLPVELTSFTVAAAGTKAVLSWRTVTEKNNYGFYVQRRKESEQTYAEVANGFVAGHGTTNVPQSYSFTDQNAGGGPWSYRLKQTDLDGAVNYHYPTGSNGTATEAVAEKPKEFSLAQNYPNPFNPTTRIQYALPKETQVRLEVFNLIGQKVATLIDAAQPAGYYDRAFDATGLPSGLYFYRLTTPEVNFLKKMMVLK